MSNRAEVIIKGGEGLAKINQLISGYIQTDLHNILHQGLPDIARDFRDLTTDPNINNNGFEKILEWFPQNGMLFDQEEAILKIKTDKDPQVVLELCSSLEPDKKIMFNWFGKGQESRTPNLRISFNAGKAGNSWLMFNYANKTVTSIDFEGQLTTGNTVTNMTLGDIKPETQFKYSNGTLISGITFIDSFQDFPDRLGITVEGFSDTLKRHKIIIPKKLTFNK